MLLSQLEGNIVVADKGFDADQQLFEPLQQPEKKPSSHPRLIEVCNERTTRNSTRRAT